MAGYGSGTAFSMFDQARGQQQGALGQANAALTGINNFANQFTGDQSRYKNALTTQLMGVTNRNYNNAAASARQRANMAGFGYQQPLSQIGQNGVEINRANALSAIPTQVDESAFQRGLSAANLQQGAANGWNQQAQIVDPQGWYQTGAQQKQQEDARKAALWQSLSQLGLGVATMGTGTVGAKLLGLGG